MRIMIYHLLVILSLIKNVNTICKVDCQYHTVLWANYVQGHQDHAQARSCYRYIFSNNPSVHIYPMFIEHLFNTNSFQGITELTSHIEQQVSFSRQQDLMIAESFLNIGDIRQASKRFEMIALASYHDIEIILKIAHLYVGIKNYQQALHHLDMLLKNSSHQSHHHIIYFTKAHLYVQMNEFTAAKKYALRSLQINPNLEQAWLLLVFIYNKESNSTQARQCYEKYNAILSSKT